MTEETKVKTIIMCKRFKYLLGILVHPFVDNRTPAARTGNLPIWSKFHSNRRCQIPVLESAEGLFFSTRYITSY